MNFPGFLDALANDELVPEFTRLLMTRPNPENNFYFGIGGRWCSVEELVRGSREIANLLKRYAFHGLDPDFSFSSCNLLAQYVPKEDFIDEGTAVVLFSLVGSDWVHVVSVSNQLKTWTKLMIASDGSDSGNGDA